MGGDRVKLTKCDTCEWDALREKCPNTEFFLARIFLYLDWIRKFTKQISLFSPNTGKYRPEKTPFSDTFHAVMKSAIIQVTYLLNDPMVIFLLYCHIILYWEKVTSYEKYYLWRPNCLEHFNVSMRLIDVSKCWKVAEFPKIFQVESFLRLWNKNALTEIRNIQTFSFQVLRECSSWAYKNGAMQMFFLTSTRNVFAGKFVKWVRFLVALQEYNFYNVEWVEVRKMIEFFERNCIVNFKYEVLNHLFSGPKFVFCDCFRSL